MSFPCLCPAGFCGRHRRAEKRGRVGIGRWNGTEVANRTSVESRSTWLVGGGWRTESSSLAGEVAFEEAEVQVGASGRPERRDWQQDLPGHLPRKSGPHAQRLGIWQGAVLTRPVRVDHLPEAAWVPLKSAWRIPIGSAPGSTDRPLQRTAELFRAGGMELRSPIEHPWKAGRHGL